MQDVPRSDAGGHDPNADKTGLPEVAIQARRVIVPACVLGVLALVVGVLIGQLLGGVGVCLGLGLGMFNARRLQSAVMDRFAVIEAGGGKPKGFLAGGALRLAVLTLLVIGLAAFVRPLGFGLVIGLAVFQVTMLGLAARSMLHQVRS